MNVIGIIMNSRTPHGIFKIFGFEHYINAASAIIHKLVFIKHISFAVPKSVLFKPAVIKRYNGLPHKRSVFLCFYVRVF